MLVRKLSPHGGPGKIRVFWEQVIPVVVSRKNPESPVYDIKPESGKVKIRTVHRNLLLPCEHLPTATPETKRVQKAKEPTLITPSFSEDPESDSEGEEGLSLPPNEIDELVQLTLRPGQASDSTMDPSVVGDTNQNKDVQSNENDANIQVEETMETPGSVEETPPQPVRPQGKDSHRYVLDTTHLLPNWWISFNVARSLRGISSNTRSGVWPPMDWTDATSENASTVDESNTTESHVPWTSDEPYDITTAFWLLYTQRIRGQSGRSKHIERPHIDFNLTMTNSGVSSISHTPEYES